MKKDSGEYHILMILAPVLVYFIVMRITAVALTSVTDMLSQDPLGPDVIYISGTMRQLICMIMGTAVIYPLFYRREKKEYALWHEREMAGRFGGVPDIKGIFFAVIVFLLACYAGNNFADVINLSSYSTRYGDIAESLYSGSFALELAAYAVVSPIAEEILYRGTVFCHIRRIMGRQAAIIISTVLFSIFHANLVQAANSLFLGLVLALFMEYYQNIAVVIAGHSAANILAVVNTEYSLWSLEKMGYDLFLGSAFVCFALVAAAVVYLIYRLRKKINIVEG